MKPTEHYFHTSHAVYLFLFRTTNKPYLFQISNYEF